MGADLKPIAVDPETHGRILELQARLQAKSRQRVFIRDAVRYAVEKARV